MSSLIPGGLRDWLAELGAMARVVPHLRRGLPGTHWNLAALLEERARVSPVDIGLAYGDDRFSWADLDREVTRYARALHDLGVRPGDVVTLLMDSRPAYLVILGALSRLRAVGALVNTNVAGPALAHALSTAKPRLIVVGEEHSEKLAALLADDDAGIDPTVYVVRDPEGTHLPTVFASLDDHAAGADGAAPRVGLPLPDEPACYIYTSGTTGLPKAAVIKNSRLLLGGGFFGAGIMDLGPTDVVYVTLPLYHTNAMLAGWSAALATGACMALRRRFSASEFWNDVRRFEATAFIYIGELCRYLLNQPARADEARHRLRIAMGNGLRPDIWERFQTRFQIPLIREFYGATEGNVALVNVAGRPGMVGRLRGGQVIVRCDPETGELFCGADGWCRRVSVGETGLLLGRISIVAPYDGYIDVAATNKKIRTNLFGAGDRYFDTGDLMVLHDGGWVSFADRLGDTFRWKGENVSTTEVAEILNGAPGVLESTVYGVEVAGSEGRAGMVSLRCDETFSIDAFANVVRERLAVYQRPYFVRLLGEMRLTGTFKQRKAEYRREGYDPELVADSLFVLEGDRYVRLDTMRLSAIRAGRFTFR